MTQIFIFIVMLAFTFSSAQAAVKGAKGEGTTLPSGQIIVSKGQVDAPKGTPTWEIQEIERKMEAFNTGTNLTATEKAKNQKLKRDILTGTFDLRELCKQALDRHWNNISDGEKTSFVNLMTNLLETKAIFSKEHSKTQGKSYVVSYKGDKYSDNKSRATSVTEIYVPKENISLDIEYRLKKTGGGWKVFDIIVDNASLVENYRYQFNSIITKQGYAELVSRMKKKLAEIRAH